MTCSNRCGRSVRGALLALCLLSATLLSCGASEPWTEVRSWLISNAGPTTCNINGTWTEPVNLGEVINSETYEYTPFIRANGEHLYFSRGWGEMWRIKLSELGSILNYEF